MGCGGHPRIGYGPKGEVVLGIVLRSF
jgi:hypothetical protein